MTLVVVGVSHHNTPLTLRERLAFPPDELGAAVLRLGQFAHEGVILSTCNRTEIYADVGHPRSGREALIRFLADSRDVPVEDLQSSATSFGQQDAVRHLFRVSAGLDSMIVGEPQILGQLRTSFEVARQHQSLSATMSRLFEQALATGKRVRTETDIARNAVSISYAAVDLARNVLQDLHGKTALVIGAGKMGELTVRTLRAHGISQLIVASRGLASAQRLAERLGGEPCTLEAIDIALAAADIVISSTASGTHILEAADVERCMAMRPNRSMLVVDIAVPRDIAPEVAGIPNVHLYNIDDLEDICSRNLTVRQLELPRAEQLIEEEVARFESWRESREIAPLIRSLVGHAESIRQAELERALARLAGLSDRDRNVVQALSVALVNKLLHDPITRLKASAPDHDGRAYARTVRDLFSLAED
ncbi:MAG: glutamyl-tRNA reductase [Chloroflexota bacterium]